MAESVFNSMANCKLAPVLRGDAAALDIEVFRLEREPGTFEVIDLFSSVLLSRVLL